MIVQSYFEPAGTYNYSSQKKTNAASSDFQNRMMAQGLDSNQQSSSAAESKKTEILNKFPALTEKRLDELMKDYNIENMDSEELFQLARQMMDEGVIPQRPQENGLNLIAVFPKALYDAFLNGDTSMMKGTVRKAFSGCFTVNQATGSLDYRYPRFGLKNLEYDLWMMQNGVDSYKSYFTDEERERQRQLAASKTGFWELSKLLAEYRNEVSWTGLGIRS